MFSLNNNNNGSPVKFSVQGEDVPCHQTFSQKAFECVQNSDFRKAIEHLINALSSSPENETLYELLFTLIPQADEKELIHILQNLSKFLEYTRNLSIMQLQLASTFADWYIALSEKKRGEEKIPLFLEAIDYYAAVIKIAEKVGNSELIHKTHRSLSTLLLRAYKIEIERRLIENKGKPDLFFQIVQSIGSFEKFCYCLEDKKLIQEIYDLAGSLTANLSSESKIHYLHSLKIIEKGIHYFKLSKGSLSEIYRKYLKDLRYMFDIHLNIKNISSEAVKKYQEEISDEMSKFINFLLKDLFVVLGEPPCGYDLRAMGSIGRKEFCPYSDLEFYVLIETEVHLPYFQRLIHQLRLQVVSLGETNLATHPVFTCLQKNLASGFYFDPGNPLQDRRLLGTPLAVAKIQEISPSTAAPNTIENSLLKSISLSTNCPALFLDYQQTANNILNKGSIRRDRFLVLCHRRYKEFHGSKEIQPCWSSSTIPNSVNLKEHYVQFLNFILADMALFWSIEETNSFDIIDRLIEKEVFTASSGFLLKRGVSQIYQMRIRLHLFYQEQKELGYQNGLSGCILTDEEKISLEQIYWLILRPLYHTCLERILDKSEPVERIFYKTDLISLCLDEIISSQENLNYFLPLIRHLAHEVYTDHLSNFKRLSIRSNLEILREEYFNLLEKNLISPALIEQIGKTPNRAGLRLSILRRERELKAKLLILPS